jgi:pyrroline-5-carboxylate reductase
MNLQEKSIGFLGCGKISSAICHGYAEGPIKPRKIYVSRRSEEKSLALQEKFPDLVEIVEDNQRLVQLSDIIFIGLLPNVAQDLLPSLPFKNHHLIISMMAAVDYQTTLNLLSNVSSDRIVRTVPLPSSARRTGPIIMFPANNEAQSVLLHVGTPVVCEVESKMKPMIAVTGHISSFYELMRTSQDFLSANGTISPFLFLPFFVTFRL